MVRTRSSCKRNMEDVIALVDKKFDEFKKSFVAELKSELDKITDTEKKEFDVFVSQKKMN